MIISIVATNHGNPQEGESIDNCNPQDGDVEFNRDDDVYKAAVAELSVCYDDDLFCRAVNGRVIKSKIAMEAGSLDVEDLTKDEDIS